MSRKINGSQRVHTSPNLTVHKRFTRLSVHGLMLFALSISVSGCNTMSSKFSCDKTAGDSCMTIEQVDRLTNYADDPESRESVLSIPPKMMKAELSPQANNKKVELAQEEHIWLSPTLEAKSWS